MKFSAKHSVKRLVAYASGNTNQYDDMVRTSGDANPVLCVINHDDLLNIEDEIRSAYEAGYQEANKNAEPAMTALDAPVMRRTTMPKFKVTATMDVAYELVVEAPNADTAWQIAKDADDISQWVKADDGHEWTMENVPPVSEVEIKDE